MGRWRFEDHPTIEGRVDVIGPGDRAVCWLPGAVAETIASAYRHKAKEDWVVADLWMQGVLFGLHHALSFGNQIPTIFVHFDEPSGVVSYQMVEDEVE